MTSSRTSADLFSGHYDPVAIEDALPLICEDTERDRGATALRIRREGGCSYVGSTPSHLCPAPDGSQLSRSVHSGALISGEARGGTRVAV